MPILYLIATQGNIDEQNENINKNLKRRPTCLTKFI